MSIAQAIVGDPASEDDGLQQGRRKPLSNDIAVLLLRGPLNDSIAEEIGLDCDRDALAGVSAALQPNRLERPASHRIGRKGCMQR